MKSVIGIGASALDTIIEMDEYPVEDVKKRADNVFISGGGPVGNALVCISKLGVKASYLGLLSKDASGLRLANEFGEYGVSTDSVRFIEDKRAFTSYIVLSKKNGTRTCVFDKGTVPDDPSLLDFEALKSCDILHLDGNYLNIALAGAKVAKSLGKKVSLDAGSVYPHIEDLLPYVDIFIASEDFARTFAGLNDLDEALIWFNKHYHFEVLVVTEGVKGGRYLEGGEVKHYASFPVDCVDSNGAGDTFHGAFLVAYLDGLSLSSCCAFASATSAIKCQKAGVRKALPNKEMVEQFLKERN